MKKCLILIAVAVCCVLSLAESLTFETQPVTNNPVKVQQPLHLGENDPCDLKFRTSEFSLMRTTVSSLICYVDDDISPMSSLDVCMSMGRLNNPGDINLTIPVLNHTKWTELASELLLHQSDYQRKKIAIKTAVETLMDETGGANVYFVTDNYYTQVTCQYKDGLLVTAAYKKDLRIAYMVIYNDSTDNGVYEMSFVCYPVEKWVWDHNYEYKDCSVSETDWIHKDSAVEM